MFKDQVQLIKIHYTIDPIHLIYLTYELLKFTYFMNY